MRLRGSVIFVHDIDRMTDFYKDGLGLRFIPFLSNGEWAEFDAGGTILGLHAIPPQYRGDAESTSPPQARPETPIKLMFETTDIHAARTHLIACGATMFEIQSRGPWAACDGLDPEGNVFQIVLIPAA